MKAKWSYLMLTIAAGNSLPGCGNTSLEPEYTVGGTVSGLAGTGLVLANGSATITIEDEGAFVLGGGLIEGSPYDVRVTTQPSAPAQVCTIVRGSGVVRADVTDVEVVCTTTPITIADSTPVDGATGVAIDVAPQLTFSAPVDTQSVQGHVSLTRGTHEITADVVASDDDTVTVTPHTPLSLLSTHTVSVDPGLLGIYGEEVEDAAVSFTTRDGSWQSTESVALDTPNAQDHALAIMPDGTAFAVWYEYDGSFANIWANTYRVGLGWGTALLLENNDLGDAVSPKVAVDANGHAYVVWSQSNGTRTDIWARRYNEGSGWDTAYQVSSGSVGTANVSPSVAVNATGDVVVAWVNTDDFDDNVWARIFPAVGAWDAAERIETAIFGSGGAPRLTMDADGNATAMWTNVDHNAGTVDLWSARYSGGEWGAPGLLESSPEPIAEHALTLDGTGRVFAAWTQQASPTAQSLYVRRYEDGAGWGTAATIATTTNGSAYYPEIAANGDGDAIVIWGQYDEQSELREYASTFSPQSGWTAPVVTPAWIAAKVAIDASGNAIIIWHAEVSITNRAIRTSRFTRGGGWAEAELLTPGATTFAQYPRVAIDARGRAVGIFIEYDVMTNKTHVGGLRFDDVP